MIIKVDVVDRAINFAKKQNTVSPSRTILLDPKGKTFVQATARKYSKIPHLILICGHYEGIDARVETLADEIVSIGDYILTGGELPAMVIVDTVARLVGEVLPKTATTTESFSENMLEAPHYTRPEVFQNIHVPKILLSGNHKHIQKWRTEAAKVITEKRGKKLKYGGMNYPAAELRGIYTRSRKILN
jgi:tRNA (guanine37-N1)-methyltransferase